MTGTKRSSRAAHPVKNHAPFAIGTDVACRHISGTLERSNQQSDIPGKCGHPHRYFLYFSGVGSLIEYSKIPFESHLNVPVIACSTFFSERRSFGRSGGIPRG